MSKYTTELRFICEEIVDKKESMGYTNVSDIIEKSRAYLFNFNYPIFDENYRPVLETKILKHYYTREIAAESVGLWKLWLDSRLNEIMPYYNQLYKSTLLEFNPFYDVDLTTDHGRKTDTAKDDLSNTSSENIDKNHFEAKRGTNTHSARGIVEDGNVTENKNSSDNAWDLYSDTPQGGLLGFPYNVTETYNSGGKIEVSNDNTYLTNARHNTNGSSETGNTTSKNVTENELQEYVNNDETTNSNNSNNYNSNTNFNSKINTIEDYLEHVKGKRGGKSYSELLLQYRKTFLNIDLEIINSLNDLFLNLW